MKSPRPILLFLSGALAAIFAGIMRTACTVTGGTGLTLDLLNGVCVSGPQGKVCYNPGSKVWTVQYAGSDKVQALAAVRRADGTVILRTPAGEALTYSDGRVIWPTGK